MPQTRSIFAVFTMALFLAACGGDDSPTDPGGNNNNDDGGDTGGETRVIKDNPSFASDVFEIFQRKGCTAAGCHGGGAGGLTLTSAAGAYSALVDVASTGTGEVLVIPSDAANSYLVKKLEGTQGVGSRMPLGGTPLDNIDLTNVKNWINTGAANN